SIGWGDALVLGGVFSFVRYGLGPAGFPWLSPLRYTTLTAALGWFTLAGATLVAVGSGLVELPSGHQVWSVTPQIAYLAIPGGVVAVLTWNAALGLIGRRNAVLFGDVLTVPAFGVEICGVYRPGSVDVVGCRL